ncbi:MAG: hypothetical protein GKS05_08615 [Nitrospirales bacterium]|nr:hypothetical protein [Nitrospirales bacterium]
MNSMTNAPRMLTHDEKKASEAAFQGRPFNPIWSKAAKAVYEGIQTAQREQLAPQDQSQPDNTRASLIQAHADVTKSKRQNPLMCAHSIARAKAIQDGLLIDVTAVADHIGLPVPVGITKTLWEGMIATSPDFSDKIRNDRTRDLLMAVRLRLANVETHSQWIDVPVLLTFPPDPIPQLFSISALFQKDASSSDYLTLIHPQEQFPLPSDPSLSS